MAGPTTREALNMEEFSAMAFIRSARPTISTMNDWRAGISKAFTTPSSADSAKMCQICDRAGEHQRGQREGQQHGGGLRGDHHAMAAVAVGHDAAHGSQQRNTGIWPAKPMPPRSTDDPVIRYTSHACATFCIQVPTSEMS